MAMPPPCRAGRRVRLRVFGAIAAALIASTGCHKRVASVSPAPTLDLQAIAARFEQRIKEGCFLCLDDVLREYGDLPPVAQQAAVLEPSVTRASLLFMFRSKELGMPMDARFQTAQAYVGAHAGALPDAQTLLLVLRAVPWNGAGVGEGFLDQVREPTGFMAPAQRDVWKTTLEAEWAQSDVAAYAYVSLVCSFGQRLSSQIEAVKKAYLGSPLIQFRAATCTNTDEAVVRRVLQENERFHEAKYFLGRWAVTMRRFAEAAAALDEAWRSIPRFTAAGVAAAELALSGDDYEETLRLSDAVLAIVPNHWRAVLDEVKALSGAGRAIEALAMADRLIASEHWYQGDGYYWRAWNEYHLDRTDAGLADVGAAKEFEKSVRVLGLAGLLRLKQQQWQEARNEFTSALALDGSVCDVRFYRGHANSGLSMWKDAAADFATAARCYVAAERALESQIASATATDDWTLRDVAKWKKELEATVEQEHSAIYNAAVGFVNARMFDEAKPYVAQAETFPAYTERAHTLSNVMDAK